MDCFSIKLWFNFFKQFNQQPLCFFYCRAEPHILHIPPRLSPWNSLALPHKPIQQDPQVFRICDNILMLCFGTLEALWMWRETQWLRERKKINKKSTHESSYAGRYLTSVYDVQCISGAILWQAAIYFSAVSLSCPLYLHFRWWYSVFSRNLLTPPFLKTQQCYSSTKLLLVRYKYAFSARNSADHQL